MRNRRAAPAVKPAPPPVDGPPIRLRSLLALSVLGALGYALFPRAQAAWQLHDRATALADYALCMVGPTGPAAVLEKPDEFSLLMRRRLLMSEREERPFASCAGLARELTGSDEISDAHGGFAAEFIEYGAPRAERAAVGDGGHGVLWSLDQLGITADVLSELYEQSWPFERSGYAALVRPSSRAREAAHPPRFPTPELGSGLPHWASLYRPGWQHAGRWYLSTGHAANLSVSISDDEGRHFRSAPLAQPLVGQYAGRCTGGAAATSFTFDMAPDGIVVESLVADDVVARRTVGQVEDVIATSCDEKTALIVVEKAERRHVVVCQHAAGCGMLDGDEDWFGGEFDVAQVEGVTVIASAQGGVVRVRSSRDLGKSWTPATVAYDGESAGRPDAAAPTRLFVIGTELLLAAPAPARKSYLMLRSMDFGASWSGGSESVTSEPASEGLVRRD